jgi:FkbM family methyltransferase
MLAERATLSLAAELCRDCAEFVDVGAHEGLFTFALNCKAPGEIQLHWFEPDRTLHDRLKENLASNGIRCVGNSAAVAARHGTARFFRNSTSDWSGSLTDHFGSEGTMAEQVVTIALSEYFAEYHIRDALVKVDVEGAGEEAWRGARDIAASIRYLLMEIIGPETQCGLPGRIISEGRFYAYYIRDFDLVVSERGNFRYVAPFWNWLFCRLAPASLQARLAGTQFRVIEATP